MYIDMLTIVYILRDDQFTIFVEIVFRSNGFDQSGFEIVQFRLWTSYVINVVKFFTAYVVSDSLCYLSTLSDIDHFVFLAEEVYSRNICICSTVERKVLQMP